MYTSSAFPRYAGNQMNHWRELIGLFTSVLAMALTFGACGRSSTAIVVGSKSSTEQMILGEIVAQHLEHRLSRKVTRRLNVGNTLIAFQALQNGEIGLYPEYTGAIVTEILREQASNDAALMFERARGEMRRVAQSELLDPLGVNNTFVGVIRAADRRASAAANMSAAAEVKDPWKIGITYDFQQRADGIPALTQYHFPMAAPVRAVDASALYRMIEEDQVSMIITGATDGLLTSSPWKTLMDDRGLFTPQQVCILVKQPLLASEPRLRAALAELSGKFTNEGMRKMNAAVDVQHRAAAAVAADFLAGAGLK